MQAGDQVWYGFPFGANDLEACVAFVAAVYDDGTVARLWFVSERGGGVLFVADPPEAQTPTALAWWRR